MRMLLALVALVPSPAFAADYFVCERPDGTVLLTDRADAVPQDCSARRTVALPAVEAASEGIDPARWKAIDEMVEEARKRRVAETLAAADVAAKVRKLRRHLAGVRLKLAEARARSDYLSWRWSAFFPTDWVPWFADPAVQRAIDEQIAALLEDEERTLQEIDALNSR